MRREQVAILLVGGLLLATPVLAAVTLEPTSGTVPIQATDGPTVSVAGASQIELTTPAETHYRVNVTTGQGQASFTSKGTTAATVQASELEGAWTNVSGLDVDSPALYIDAADKPNVSVEGKTDTLAIADGYAVDDGAADFVYSGASGQTTLTVPGLPASTTVGAVDTATQTLLATDTTDGSGTATLSLPNSKHTIRLTTTSGGPTVDNGTLAPTSTVTTEDVTLSATVTDPDFPADNVTAAWYVNGTKRNTTYITANGTATAAVGPLADGPYQWHVELTDGYGATATSANATFTVAHPDPTITAAAPTGELNRRPDELNVSVTDPDFGGDGDTVTGRFYLDGSLVGTDSRASNGSLTAPIGGQSAGQHNWRVALNDSYGGAWTNQSYQFTTPGNLTIRNESNASQIVDNATVSLRFFFNETGEQALIVDRTATNGTINMTGLPTDQPFVVVADADGYRPRRIFVPSLFEQQDIYLLPDEANFVRVQFRLADFTGQFPQDTTVLEVQRGLNGTFRTVLGDYFGANGEFPAQLAFNERHRLQLRNTNTGEVRRVGTVSLQSSQESTIVVDASGNISSIERAPRLRVRPLGQLPARANVSLTATVTETDTPFQSATVAAYLINGTADTNTTLFTNSSSVSFATTRAVNLSGHAGETVKVIVRYDTGAVAGSIARTLPVVSGSQHGTSLLTGLDQIVGLIPAPNRDTFTAMAAVVVALIGTVSVGARFRLSGELLGGVALLFVAGFGVLGWLPYRLLFVSVAGWGALVFLRRRY